MKRVLYVIDTLKQRAGITSFIRTYIEQFSKEIQVDILALEGSEEEVIHFLKECGCRVYLAPYPNSIKKGITYDRFVNMVMSENQYDIIHSHFVQVTTLVFLIARKHGVKKLIAHSHNTRLSDSRFKAIVNRVLFFPSKYIADVWAACSEEAGVALYGNKFINSKKKFIIKNAIDTTRFRFSEEKRSLIREKYGLHGRTILFVGGFRKQKNVPFLIDVYKCLLDKCRDDNYDLVLVGDGEERSLIEEKISRCDLCENIILTGSRNNVQEYMSGCDLFVLPSLYEGLGLVLIEAQANGLKCLASDGIPKESMITDNIDYIPLSMGPDYWAERIKGIDPVTNKERSMFADSVRLKGYDIVEQANRVIEYYENL